MAIVKSADTAKIFDEIRDQRDEAIKRAEAAEAALQAVMTRAAKLSIEAEHYKYLSAQLEAEKITLHASMKSAESERDEARRQLEQAVAAEREACAKVADEIEHSGMVLEVKMKHKIAAAIRARK